VTSLAYLYGGIDFNNLRSEISYDAFREYCQSKLANFLFTIELQRRINAKGHEVQSLAAHPGLAVTEISRHMTAAELASVLSNLGPAMEAWQGALPSLYASVSPKIKGGALYGPDAEGGLRGYPADSPVAEIALDEFIAQDLWKLSESATGVIFP
jgi:NAD(P)-dependent dehydrogenase (short-subunit alcohol dehydrogenase family)